MRGLKSTLALLVVLIGLGAYIYFVDSRRPASGTETREKVFTVEADKIQEIRLTAGDETSVLRKVDGTWRMAEPVQADADQSAVSSLTSNLATLEVNRVVEETAGDLGQYGLADPAVEVAFKADGDISGQVAFGDKTATAGDLYALKPGDKRVFLVPAYLESTFNKKSFDLRDKSALKFERDKADVLEVVQGPTRLHFARSGSEWKVEQPVQARGDYGAIEGLLTRLSTASMSKLVEPDATNFAKYGLDRPAVTASVGTGSSRAVLAIGREENGEVYARDQARPMVFTLDPTLVTDLKKGVDDYRDKDLFEFRSFNTDRIRIARGADVFEFQKVRGTGENATDTWQRVAGGDATDVETTKMEDVLTKLSNLRAQSFSGTDAATGLQQPALTVGVSFDQGKFERVRVGRSGGEVFAAREGEPGAARLDVSAFDEAVKAFDALLAPPPAPSPAASGK
jgi:Domain of unknown function (DUF4340)